MAKPVLETYAPNLLSSASSAGWVSLWEWVDRKRSEARRAIRKANRDNFVAGYEITYQRGRLAVLAELRKDLTRAKKVTPNGGDMPHLPAQ